MNREALRVILAMLNTMDSQLEALVYKSKEENLIDAKQSLRTASKAMREYFIQSE